MDFKNFQQHAWYTLFSQAIDEIFSEKNFSYNDIKVKFYPVNANAFLKTTSLPLDTHSMVLKVRIHVEYRDEQADFTTDLVDLPIYGLNGITIKGAKWAITNVTNRASGWYILDTRNSKKKTKCGPTLTLNRSAQSVFTFKETSKGTIEVEIKSVASKESIKMPLFTFLKAISGDPTVQFEDIADYLADCSHVMTSLYVQEESTDFVEPTTADAASELLHILTYAAKNYSWADPISEINKRLGENRLRIGKERIPRFKKFVSFARAVQEGVTVVEDIPLPDGRMISAGEALTDEYAQLLDQDAAITEILVAKRSKIYTLKKTAIQKGITFDEVCCALRIYDQYLDGLGVADDPDEQYNKVINSVKDEYEKYISEALYNFVVALSKKFQNNPNKDPIDLVTGMRLKEFKKPLSEIADRINRESKYQQLDDTNSISIFDQQYKISNSTSQVPATARDIHPMQYGRVCPYTTPESKQVGLNLSLSVLSSVDEYGFITTPVYPFVNGKLEKEPVYVSAIDELDMVIAPVSADLETLWQEHGDDPAYTVPDCHIKGNVRPARLNKITHRAVSDIQTIGPLMATVPSANRNAGKRLVMSAAAQRQALPVWHAERPLVTTGVDAMINIGIETASEVMNSHLLSVGVNAEVPEGTKLIYRGSRIAGELLKIDFEFNFNNENYVVTRCLPQCTSTSKGAFKYRRLAPPANLGEHGERYYTGSDLVFYNNDVDISTAEFSKNNVDYGGLQFSTDAMKNHGVAIGENVKIMFKSFEGYTYEDSIVVSEALLAKQGLTIVKTTTLKYTLSKDEKPGYNANQLGTLPQLDSSGYPRTGYYVQTGQAILAVAKEIKGKDNTTSTKYHVETLDVGQSGFVISHKVSEGERGETIIRISLGEISPVGIGDKLEGLHGNKGVIGRICKEYELPYTEDGEVADIILNPLGNLARLNLGQIIECTLGATAAKTGKIQILEPFATKSIADILADAEANGIVEKTVYDGRTGLKFDKPGMIGNMYMLRLEHTSTSKYNATNNCASNINARTMQPGSGAGGGQKMSELCTWCLVSYNAMDTLNTLLTVQSDSKESKSKLDNAIQSGSSTNIPYSSSNISMLKAYFYMLGCNIAIDGENMRLELLTQSFIDYIAPQKLNLDRLRRGGTSQELLHDMRVFKNQTNSDIYAQLPFNCKMIMPIYLKNNTVCKLFSYYTKDNKGAIVKGRNFGSTNLVDDLISGAKALIGWSTNVQTIDKTKEYFKNVFGIVLPEAYEVPIIVPINKTAGEEKVTTGIRAVVEIFSRYKVIYNLCSFTDISDSVVAENAKLIENFILFMQNYELSDFIVESMVIPPPIYRPISDRDNKMSNPIDSQLNTIVGSIHYLLGESSDSYRAAKETSLYNAILKATKTTNVKDKDNPPLIQQLTDHKHKASILRDTLLSKRVSYTGRSVISIGPELELGECGVPICMLATIFEGHIIAKLMSDPRYLLSITARTVQHYHKFFFKHAVRYIANNNIKGFFTLCMQRITCSIPEALANISTAYDGNPIPSMQALFDKCHKELEDILVELLKEYPSLLNREPSLHMFSIQGFNAKPVNSFAIQLHPLNCHGFNADYDGDQMACIFPMHEQARIDTRDKMMTVNNLIDPKDGKGIIALNQDMILGLYYATIHRNNAITRDTAEQITAAYVLKPFDTGFFRVPFSKSYGIATPIAEDIFAGKLRVHDTILCEYEGRYYVSEAGRIIINSLLPGGIGFTTERNQQNNGIFTNTYQLKVDFVLSKKTIKSVEDICIKYFDQYSLKPAPDGDTLAAVYNRLMTVGFKFADLSGITMSLYDFAELPVKKLMQSTVEGTKVSVEENDGWYNLGFCTEEDRSSNNINAWSSATKSMKQVIAKEFASGTEFDRMSNIFLIIDSGARGDVNQLLEISGMIGIVANSSGERLETPIMTSYMDGLSSSEFHLNSYTARRQTAAAQLTTADAGEFTRECIYLNEHIRIHGEDTDCDAHGLWIELQYEPLADIEIKSEDSLVVEPQEIDSIPLDVFMSLDFAMFNPEGVRDAYKAFCTSICDLLDSPVYTDEFKHLLVLNSQSFFIMKRTTGEYVCVTVTFKLTPQSRRMLMYRVLDIAELEANPKTKGYADTWRSKSQRVLSNVPSSVYNSETNPEGYDLIIGDELIDAIETATLFAVPIYTIIGCKSTTGICRRCFGLKYDSRKFPAFKESIGYQAVQAIGNPITQLILDSHKSEYTGEKSTKEKLEDILNNDTLPQKTIPENINLPFALQDDTSMRVKRIDGGYGISLSTGNEVYSEFKVSSLTKLKCKPGETRIPKGTPAISVDSEYYPFWVAVAPENRVQLDIWQSLCECFDKEDILARNFEVFARSLTEFGMAESNNIQAGIIKGGVYTTTKLREAGVSFSPAFLSVSREMQRADKIMSGVAFADAAANLCDAIIRGVHNNKQSNIGDSLVGNLSTAQYKLATHSVIDGKFSKPNVIEIHTEEIVVQQDPKVEDEVLSQLTGVIDTIISSDEKEQEVYEQNDSTVEDHDTVKKTDYFGGT